MDLKTSGQPALAVNLNEVKNAIDEVLLSQVGSMILRNAQLGVRSQPRATASGKSARWMLIKTQYLPEDGKALIEESEHVHLNTKSCNIMSLVDCKSTVYTHRYYILISMV